MSKRSFKVSKLLRVGTLAILAGTAQGAYAQASTGKTAAEEDSAGLSEIIVTAQRRPQNAQDVPIMITALSGAQLAERGVASVQDLARVSPGVLITEFGGSPTTTSINIRGVAQLDFGDHQEAPNALYVGGVYVSFPGAVGTSMFDVDGLEVLRGPQGTLFGRNATGGLIQITPKRPTKDLDGYVQASYGSYDRVNLEGAIGGTVAGNLTGRVSVAYNRQDGFYKNTMGPDLGRDNTLNARVQLQYEFDADTKNLLSFFISRSFPVDSGAYIPYPIAMNPANHFLAETNSGSMFVDGCAALGLAVAPGATNCYGYKRPASLGPWDVEQPHVGRFDRTFYSLSNTFTKQFSFATLTSISNYTKYDRNYSEDTSAAPSPIYGYYTKTDAYQLSQELRLNGKSGGLDWVVGGYALNIHGNYSQALTYGDFAVPAIRTEAFYTQDVLSLALFGQLDYKLTDKLTLIAGLRGNVDRKSIDVTGVCSDTPATCAAYFSGPTGAGFAGVANDTDWSGRLQLSYAVDRDVMVYAGVNRGNKAAVVVVPPQSPFGGVTFAGQLVKPEVLTAYEVGFKSTFLDNRLRVNGDVFYYDYANMQAFRADGAAAVLFNAQARSYGGEIEVTARPMSHTTLSGSVAYLHTKVLDVSLPDGSIADQQAPFAPHWAASANLRQEIPTDIGGFYLQGSVNYTGSHFFNTVNEQATLSPSYTTVDLSAGWDSPDSKTHISVLAKNLTNKDYAIYAFNLAVLGGYGVKNNAPPRWISVQLRRDF